MISISLSLHILLVVVTALDVANSTWWFISQFNTNSSTESRILCDLIPKRVKHQRKLCEKHSEVIQSMTGGIRAAITECQYQFRANKWNCTTFERDPTVFGKYFVRGGTRELSFVHAITTAASVLSVARDCASGRLPCGCSTDGGEYEKIPPVTTVTKDFKWKGCAQNVIYSLKFVRRFVDASEVGVRDAKAKTTLHNNRAGRKIFEQHAPLLCKCHGLSGSCTVETCWRTPPNMRALGDILKEKYDGAIRIRIDPAGRLVPVNRLQKKPGKLNLVYYEDSPDFCYRNRSRGLMGTDGRPCNATSEGEDSCDILCCGRGWNSKTYPVTYRCECRFIWCCEVKCEQCHGLHTESRCKSYLSSLPTSLQWQKH